MNDMDLTNQEIDFLVVELSRMIDDSEYSRTSKIVIHNLIHKIKIYEHNNRTP